MWKNRLECQYKFKKVFLKRTVFSYCYMIELLFCHSYIELRVRLRLNWGWFRAEVEMRLRWGWVEVYLNLSWVWVELVNVELRKKLDFHMIRLWFKICLRSTHIAKQHIFSMSSSILVLVLPNLREIFWLLRAKE